MEIWNVWELYSIVTRGTFTEKFINLAEFRLQTADSQEVDHWRPSYTALPIAMSKNYKGSIARAPQQFV